MFKNAKSSTVIDDKPRNQIKKKLNTSQNGLVDNTFRY